MREKRDIEGITVKTSRVVDINKHSSKSIYQEMAEYSLFDGADSISDEDILNCDFDEVINILGTKCGVEEEISIICDEVSTIFILFT